MEDSSNSSLSIRNGRDRMGKKRRFLLVVICVSLFVIAAVILVLVPFGEERPATVERGKDTGPDTPTRFTFLGLGSNTRLSGDLRARLKKQLGAGAISERGTLDLEFSDGSIIRDHFPELDDLNRRLNYSPRERIEHHITRLMYRYPQRNNLPFKYVELIFSNDSRRPMMFRIVVLPKEGPTLFLNLEEKYGTAADLSAKDGAGAVKSWKQDGEMLIAAETRDRFGQPEYHITLFFIKTIDALLQAEESDRLRRKLEKEDAGKTAF